MSALNYYRATRSFVAGSSAASGHATFHPSPVDRDAGNTIYIKRIRVYNFCIASAGSTVSAGFPNFAPVCGWLSCQKNGADMNHQPFIAVAWLGGGKTADDTMSLIPDSFSLAPTETLLEEWFCPANVYIPYQTGGGFGIANYLLNDLTIMSVIEVSWSNTP
jgi:hypothetical protein